MSNKKTTATVNPSDSSAENAGTVTANDRLPRKWWQSDWVFWFLLAAVTMLAYHPAWNGQQLWDDDQHMIRPELYPVSGLIRIWTDPRAIRQYYPVLGTVFWVENKIWGTAPMPHHLINILTHSLVALLLLFILRRLEIPGARLATLLFALHPVQVESVAWNTELKNTLSGLFCLAATLFYLRFDQKRRWLDYAVALALFACALLSKTVVATLPAALLVILWWKRGKLSWKSDVLPTIPFFASSAGLGVLSVWMEHNVVGAEGADFQYSVIERCLIAGRAVWFYLGKLIWPHPLVFIYPRWQISQMIWWQYLFPLTALGLLIGLWLLRAKSRGPLAALLLFAGTLFPALGFFNVYPFRFSFVADHFQYLACIGPLALVAAGITMTIDSMKQSAAQLFRPVVAVVLGGVLAVLTWQQSRIYTDIETLWHATLAENPDCWVAYGHLGWILFTRGDVDASISNLERALKIKPGDADVHDSLGLALKQKGQLDEAMAHFEETLKLRPNDSVAVINLGNILEQRNQLDAAVNNYRKALEQKPDDAEIHARLGGALRRQGILDQAMAHLQLALDKNFEDARLHRDLGLALHQKGRIAEALPHYQRALAMKPDYAEAHNDLGVALLQNGQAAEAIRQFKETLKLVPDNAETLDNLAWLLATASPASLRNGAEAVEFAERAAKGNGGKDPSVLNTLSAAYAQAGRFEDAVATAQKALRLAEARSDATLASTLVNEIKLYQMHRALP